MVSVCCGYMRNIFSNSLVRYTAFLSTAKQVGEHCSSARSVFRWRRHLSDNGARLDLQTRLQVEEEREVRVRRWPQPPGCRRGPAGVRGEDAHPAKDDVHVSGVERPTRGRLLLAAIVIEGQADTS